MPGTSTRYWTFDRSHKEDRVQGSGTGIGYRDRVQGSGTENLRVNRDQGIGYRYRCMSLPETCTRWNFQRDRDRVQVLNFFQRDRVVPVLTGPGPGTKIPRIFSKNEEKNLKFDIAPFFNKKKTNNQIKWIQYKLITTKIWGSHDYYSLLILKTYILKSNIIPA